MFSEIEMESDWTMGAMQVDTNQRVGIKMVHIMDKKKHEGNRIEAIKKTRKINIIFHEEILRTSTITINPCWRDKEQKSLT